MSKEDKKYKSKWFRIAVAGDTTDGREIQADWIIQMAANYDPNTYGARINMEHFRSVFPDGVFGAYGDVLALKTEKVDINGEEKDALFAQIEPTQSLIELNSYQYFNMSFCDAIFKRSLFETEAYGEGKLR